MWKIVTRYRLPQKTFRKFVENRLNFGEFGCQTCPCINASARNVAQKAHGICIRDGQTLQMIGCPRLPLVSHEAGFPVRSFSSDRHVNLLPIVEAIFTRAEISLASLTDCREKSFRLHSIPVLIVPCDESRQIVAVLSSASEAIQILSRPVGRFPSS